MEVIKTDFASTNDENSLISYLPGEDQGASAFHLGEILWHNGSSRLTRRTRHRFVGVIDKLHNLHKTFMNFMFPVGGYLSGITAQYLAPDPLRSDNMSARKIGGGRVLGSGRSLSPAVALQPKRNSSLLSPSTSSVSLNSSASTSHTSTEPQDLSSRVSLDQHDGAGAALGAASTSRLVCPICNEEMVRPRTALVGIH